MSQPPSRFVLKISGVTQRSVASFVVVIVQVSRRPGWVNDGPKCGNPAVRSVSERFTSALPTIGAVRPVKEYVRAYVFATENTFPDFTVFAAPESVPKCFTDPG